MSEVVQLGFDYGALDVETRLVVQQRTEEIKAALRRTAEDIVDVGRKLADVRARLQNGQFDNWLAAEFEMSRRTAYNFIGVFERFGRANFAQFDVAVSALYLLAAPGTPEGARREAISRAEEGERITHATAQQIVAEHKPRQEVLAEDVGGGDTAREASGETPRPVPKVDLQRIGQAQAAAPRPAPVMMPIQTATPADVISIRILPGLVLAERRVMLMAGVEGRAPSVMRGGVFGDLVEMVRALVGEYLGLATVDAVLADIEMEGDDSEGV